MTRVLKGRAPGAIALLCGAMLLASAPHAGAAVHKKPHDADAADQPASAAKADKQASIGKADKAASADKSAGKAGTAPDAGKPAKKGALTAKPTLVGTFGDWGAYEAQGAKSKICYALAQPKERTPSALKRDQGYIFISSRPGENVHNEVSVIMGLPLKEGSGDARAEIGTTNFDLVTKGQNAWMKDSGEESRLVGAMKKHGRLVVKAPSSKGAVATDSYSLTGLGPALDRVAKDCS